MVCVLSEHFKSLRRSGKQVKTGGIIAELWRMEKGLNLKIMRI
ncbi:hypothetical protein C5S42_01930, partial [Candidatus Methanomarinus sp.]